MPYKVKLHSRNKRIVINAKPGENLFTLIQKYVENFYAPCGGMGTCGKCRVHILNEDYVIACLYEINKNIEVILPGELEMEVLASQHNFITKIIHAPGSAINLAIQPLGMAIDIGTTSIVFYLIDLKKSATLDIYTIPNPQIKFGSDIISRINYTNTSNDGLKILQQLVIDSINKHIKLFTKKIKTTTNSVTKIVVVGNPAMMHILLGIDPLPLALVPFAPSFTELKRIDANKLGLVCNNKAKIIVMPSVSGYIGADIVAGIASIDVVETSSVFLFVDIGTNGEIALITPSCIWCCATAAGPAFEGANIKFGMGAFPGAISHYNNEGFITIDELPPIGICGSGLIDIISHLLNEGIMTAEGNIKNDFLVSSGKENGIQQEIVVTQQDIRELQLAKSAIISGINILLKKADLTINNLDKIFIAGGFGNYINIESAINIGLLPDAPEKIIQVGNTAGTGAVLAIKSEPFIAKTERIKKIFNYIELSTSDEFTDEFAMNMMFQ